MKIARKRCEFCHEWFTPNPRTIKTQRSCTNPHCRKQRRNRAVRDWRRRNPDCNKGRGHKIRDWAKSYPNYWRQYRRQHPEYTARDNRRRCSAYREHKISAKRNEITRISLEKLESIRKLEPVSSAKRNEIHRRVEGILDYLFWKERAAKQNEMAFLGAGERQCEYATANLGRNQAFESG